TSYGYLPDQETHDNLNVDVWGLQIYAWLGFGSPDAFQQWSIISTKPMFMAEYGADAWNSTIPAYDTTSQSNAAYILTKEILSNSSAVNSTNVCAGGTIFEWCDEWWKVSSGDLWGQDIGGLSGGTYPDAMHNEEYWGLVDIYRVKRPAFDVIKKLYTSE
ncbi:MAG: hypothetical protein KAR07_06500, partial [Spirochaetes bacterium]|nr:hypothetical protein [Spirochaetota bacterium]